MGRVVKESALSARDPRYKSQSTHTSDFRLVAQWLPCQTPGRTGSVPELVGPVSLHGDWVCVCVCVRERE